MIKLNEENTVLFGEQVGDHIAKLNDLMGHSSGEALREQVYRKTCFANSLLEGSTRMLGLQEWSSTIRMFSTLLARVSDSTGCWDENISNLVSEILETEEQLVAEITEGSIEESGVEEVFSGLQQEIEVLLEEAYPQGESVEEQFEEIGELSLEKDTLSIDEPSGSATMTSSVTLPPVSEGAPERFGTLDRLVTSLEKVNDRYLEYISEPDDERGMIRDLELAYGESEFFLGLVGNILRQMGDSGRQFRAKVASRTVLDGVEEFIMMNSRLRGWKVELETKADSFSLEREAASDLAMIMEYMILDVCRIHEDEDMELKIDIEVENEGSFLVATLRDNGKAWLSDSAIDKDDAVAFYKGLLKIRGMLKKWGCLLWVEPAGGSEGRFRFTFPRTTVMTDYLLLQEGDVRVAVPHRVVETSLERGSLEATAIGGIEHIDLDGEKVPVCGLDDLASEEIDTSGSGENIVIVGLAEKRLGLRVSSAGQKVECIVDQLTGGDWASLTRQVLHIGDVECPVLDVGLVLDKYASILGLEGPMDESGFSAADESGADTDVNRISRV